MRGKKILIVDDNKDFADVFCDILQTHDYNAVSCYSGQDAVNKIGDRLYDITFLDIKMPDKDGVETLKEIKRVRPESKVIMMTGYSMDETLKGSLDEDAAGILVKPFEVKDVLDLIERVR